MLVHVHSRTARLLLVLFMLSVAAFAQSHTNLVQYVDPFIGVDGGGSVFPGATLPFGMVKLGPDTENLFANPGYDSASRVIGFSHVHTSGSGGGAKYGNILVTPMTGNVDPGRMGSDRASEAAVAGYYTTKLTRYAITAAAQGRDLFESESWVSSLLFRRPQPPSFVY